MQLNIDEFDLRILRALKKDGAQTNAQLSSIIGLSSSQCSRRRTRLEADGIISGYQAKLNSKAMGLEIRAVVRVNLTSHTEKSATEFSYLIETREEIVQAYSVSGDADYVLMIQCENLEAFGNFIHRTILPHPNITQVRSEIVLRTLKDE